MPIEIVKKQKTEPKCPNQHKALVPLRVVAIERVPGNLTEHLDKEVQNGDVIMAMPSVWCRLDSIFNCTKGGIIDRRLNECIRCVRAYDIARVLLCNDDEPAPVE